MSDLNDYLEIKQKLEELEKKGLKPTPAFDPLFLLKVLWQSKFIIIGITSLFTAYAIYIAFNKPDIYKAETIVVAVEENSTGMRGALGGQLGGLATLTGLDIGQAKTGKVTIALELMRSWNFLERFIKENELGPLVIAAENWDKGTNKVIFNKDFYDSKSKQWLIGADHPQLEGVKMGPSSWDLFQAFNGSIDISTNKSTGLISVAIEHVSPEIAAKLTTLLIQDINNYLREEHIREVEKSIYFLNKRLSETTITEMKSVFYQLIEQQTRALMLANISDEYVLKTIDKAKVPHTKVKPKRKMIVILGTMLGGAFSVLLVFLLFYFRKLKEDDVY